MKESKGILIESNGIIIRFQLIFKGTLNRFQLILIISCN